MRTISCLPPVAEQTPLEEELVGSTLTKVNQLNKMTAPAGEPAPREILVEDFPRGYFSQVCFWSLGETGLLLLDSIKFPMPCWDKRIWTVVPQWPSPIMMVLRRGEGVTPYSWR